MIPRFTIQELLIVAALIVGLEAVGFWVTWILTR